MRKIDSQPYFKLALACVALCSLMGYTPPVDTAGPLTVRIVGPALGNYGAGGLMELNQTGVPMPYTVSLENSSDTAVHGTLRVQVTDRWRVEPATAVPFTVEPRGGAILEWSRSPALVYVNARPLVLEPVSQWERGAGPDPRPVRMNTAGTTIAFDGVTTTGAVRLARGGDGLRIVPLPNSPRFAIRVKWNALPWKLGVPRQAEALDEDGNVLRRAAVTTESGELVLTCEPGVFGYRLS